MLLTILNEHNNI